MSEFKLTKVVNVDNVDPEVWLADPNHVYVDKRWYIRQGKFRDKTWPNSGWQNPCIKPQTDANGFPERTDWENYIHRYELYLAGQKLLIQQLPSLIGKTLGTMWYSWNGISRPRPLSHACVIADWANGLARGERLWEKLNA